MNSDQNLTQEFEDWVRKQHLDRCPQCQKEGKARLQDTDWVSVQLFKEFYKQYKTKKQNKK